MGGQGDTGQGMIVRMEADVLGVSWDLADATGSGWSWRRRSRTGKSLG